jgi:MinD superfamily P-loop ATPase
MRELVVISGKGGTGKTSLVGALAAVAQNKVLCDADVDAADLHLLLAPNIVQRHDFVSGRKAVIQADRCIECGECVKWCRFEAIDEHLVVNEFLCEGCGVCYYFCPAGAIDFIENHCGEWFVSETRFGPLIHARLGIAEENSGKLVSLVRKEARRLAEERNLQWILTDGPPGIGCPVIASIGGASAVLIVSEPTVSGIHDLARAAELAAHFGIPAFACVNKADLFWDAAREIEENCARKGIPFLGHIPFDPVVTRAQVDGLTVVEYDKNPVADAVRRFWEILEADIPRSTDETEANPTTSIPASMLDR